MSAVATTAQVSRPPPHWSAGYIGRPYRRGAPGPDVVDCWSGTRCIVHDQFGLLLPAFTGAVEPLLTGAAAAGWVRVAEPDDGDVMQGRTVEGLHAGVVARLRGRLWLVHATRAWRCMVRERLEDALVTLHDVKYWRRPC